MVQVDLPGAFAAGQLLAVLSKKYLKSEQDRFTHRLMGPIGWYFALMFSPVGMFLLIGWPAWEGMYWWDWVEKPAFNPPVAFFYIFFYLAMIILGNGSYILAHKLYLEGKDKVVNFLAVTGCIATLLPFFLWPYTWFYVGTYAQYHAAPGSMDTMFKTPSFFYPWLIAMSYFAISSVLFAVWLKKYSASLCSSP